MQLGDYVVLPTNHIPSMEEFLEALGVGPSGLGAQLYSAVYRQFFVWSTNLRVQYERYYCVEYATLETYLALGHDIELDKVNLEKRYILQVTTPSGVVDQAYDRNSFDVVVDTIRKLEGMHES